MLCIVSIYISYIDIFRTLKYLGFLKWARGEHIVSVTPKLLETHRTTYCTVAPGKKITYVQFDPNKLIWTPPPQWREIKKTDKPTHKRIMSTTEKGKEFKGKEAKEKSTQSKVQRIS